jgi:hypothetical protein
MSSLMDVLGGGGGPPPPPGAGPPPGPPPDLGAGPPPGAGPGPGPGGDDVYESSLQALDVAEHALQAFMRLDHDAPDKAQAARALTIVAQLKGANQTDASSGGGKSLVRALSGAPSPIPGLGG